MRQIITVSTLFSSLFLVACDPAKSEENALPSIVAQEGDCFVAPQLSSTCDWAAPADAVVLGTIKQISGEDSPVGFADGTVGTPDDCDGPINRSVRIILTVDDVLFGSAPSEVVVSVGSTTYDKWSPRLGFSAQDEGVVVWDGGLAVAQQIGVALYTADGSTWAIRGRLFNVVEGDVAFQSGEINCQEVVPDFSGSFTEFAAELSDCQLDVEANDSFDEAFTTGSPSVMAECTVAR